MFKMWLRMMVWPKSHGTISAANIAEGTHEANITKKVDAVIATRHLAVKVGSDIDHVAVTTAATEKPLGMVNDEAEAIEDDVNVQLLGKGGTKLGVAVGTITADDDLCAAAGGKLQTCPTAGGTYYIIGRALNGASADGIVEFVDCVPVKRIVT